MDQSVGMEKLDLKDSVEETNGAPQAQGVVQVFLWSWLINYDWFYWACYSWNGLVSWITIDY